MAKTQQQATDELIDYTLTTHIGILLSALTLPEFEAEGVIEGVLLGLEWAGVTMGLAVSPVLLTLIPMAVVGYKMDPQALSDLVTKIFPATTSGVGVMMAGPSMLLSPDDDQLLLSRLGAYASDVAPAFSQQGTAAQVGLLRGMMGQRSAQEDMAAEAAYLGSLLSPTPTPSGSLVAPHGTYTPSGTQGGFATSPSGLGAWPSFGQGFEMPGLGESGFGGIGAPSGYDGQGYSGPIGTSITVSGPGDPGLSMPGGSDYGDPSPPSSEPPPIDTQDPVPPGTSSPSNGGGTTDPPSGEEPPGTTPTGPATPISPVQPPEDGC